VRCFLAACVTDGVFRQGADDDRAIFQASPDELPVIDIYLL